MASVRLEDIHKIYAGGVAALRGIDLEVADGELVVLVGPSGCGKSTLLRLVAGLEAPTRGRIRIEGQDVTNLDPRERDIAMVFQTYALYPHMSVRQNLGFGLRMRGVSRSRIEARVGEVARTLGLEPHLERRPGQLSGGQRQRVALGRAIAREPKVFLFDEPLSNLDARLRVETRTELARIHRQLGATMIYVTHDQEEAMTLGDRVVVLRDGVVQQAGLPMEIYARPANAFVAGFLGSPAMNLLRGSLRVEEGRRWFEAPGLRLDLEAAGQGLAAAEGVLLGIRPHDIRVVEPSGAGAVARVEVVEPLGSQVLVHLVVEAGEDSSRITAAVAPETAPGLGQRVGLRFDRDKAHLFDAATGKRKQAGARAG
ncbi:MAG: sn-glycerol-3-phosphate ABC transporter ATP-binding protein UgpC [Acidobacteriota bacterium]